MKLVANSERSLAELCEKIVSTWNEKRYVRVTLTTGRERSLDQNALAFAMYTRISETLGDGSAEDISHWRAYCKLRCGVPILLVHSELFRNRWKVMVLDNPALHGWHQQLALMADTVFGVDGFPVSRLMTTKMFCEYTNSIDRHFSDQGVYFQDLLEDKSEKQAKHAQARKSRSKGPDHQLAGH